MPLPPKTTHMIWRRDIDPGKVFDLELPLAEAPKGTLMTSWSHKDLAMLAAISEIRIAPLRQDGKRFAEPTTIWSVTIAGNLFVRAYNGPIARWYRTATAQRLGRIETGDTVFDVEFEEVDRSIDDVVDAAYKAKYAHNPHLAPMLAPAARAATLQISPRTPEYPTTPSSAVTNGMRTVDQYATEPWQALLRSMKGHHS